jgi:hypothetical protein
MKRRQWIGGTAAAAVLLLGAGALYQLRGDTPPDDPYRFRVLDDEERAILAAIGPVMLAGALPAGGTGTNAFIEGFDTAVAGLPPHVQGELAQLFMLLKNGVLRVLATGVMHPWHEASQEEIARFLTAWRYSGIVKLRAGYDALHQLTLAAWYGNPVSWSAIGYPGPPVVR